MLKQAISCVLGFLEAQRPYSGTPLSIVRFDTLRPFIDNSERIRAA